MSQYAKPSACIRCQLHVLAVNMRCRLLCKILLEPVVRDPHHGIAGIQAVAFGMGGGLLQKVNRDTMQFATKLSHIVYADGSAREIAKMPKTDPAKVCSGRQA